MKIENLSMKNSEKSFIIQFYTQFNHFTIQQINGCKKQQIKRDSNDLEMRQYISI